MRKNIFILKFFIILQLFAIQSALSDDKRQWLWLGTGVFTQNNTRTSTSPSGETSLLGTPYPALSASGDFRFKSWSISPAIYYTPLNHTSPEGGETTHLMAVALRGVKNSGPFGFIFGIGDLFTTISGSGGTKDLNNGTSTTTFGLPSNSVTAQALYLDAGASIKFYKFIRIDLDMLIVNIMSSHRRAFNTVLFVQFGVL